MTDRLVWVDLTAGPSKRVNLTPQTSVSNAASQQNHGCDGSLTTPPAPARPAGGCPHPPLPTRQLGLGSSHHRTRQPPRPLSGPHPTLKEAEGARDFLVGLLNTHPKLHIMGPDPQPSHQVPTVTVFSHAPNEPWYLLCLNTEGTVDAISPPYPTRQAATHTLEQLGLLNAATATRDIGNRAVAAPTSTSCQCSLKGWRCEHIELSAPEIEPPNRGHGLSLWSDNHERGL